MDLFIIYPKPYSIYLRGTILDVDAFDTRACTYAGLGIEDWVMKEPGMYLGVYRGCIGIMVKKIETAIMGYCGILVL